MQKAKKTMPSRTGIPPDAQAEILQKLSAETKITSCEIAEILKKHDVCGDMDALQDAYRKRLGQRLLSGIRDENGKREILSTSGGEYVIVDCCNDPQKLKAIQRRIQRVQRMLPFVLPPRKTHAHRRMRRGSGFAIQPCGIDAVGNDMQLFIQRIPRRARKPAEHLLPRRAAQTDHPRRAAQNPPRHRPQMRFIFPNRRKIAVSQRDDIRQAALFRQPFSD